MNRDDINVICTAARYVEVMGPAEALLFSVLTRYSTTDAGDGLAKLTLDDIEGYSGLTKSSIMRARRNLMNFGVIGYSGGFYEVDYDRLEKIADKGEPMLPEEDVIQPKKIALSAFLEAANATLPDGARKLSVPRSTASGPLWWKPLGYITEQLCDGDVEEAVDLIRRTVRAMRRDNLTIKSVKSIVKVAENELREMRRERWTQLSTRESSEEVPWTPL